MQLCFMVFMILNAGYTPNKFDHIVGSHRHWPIHLARAYPLRSAQGIPWGSRLSRPSNYYQRPHHPRSFGLDAARPVHTGIWAAATQDDPQTERMEGRRGIFFEKRQSTSGANLGPTGLGHCKYSPNSHREQCAYLSLIHIWCPVQDCLSV